MSGRRYTYDAAGLLMGVVDDIFGSARFEHDLDGYLRTAIYPDRDEHFEVNGDGDPPWVPTSLSSDGDRTTQTSGWTLRWDREGRLIEKRKGSLSLTLTFNAAGLLTEVVRETLSSGSDEVPQSRIVTSFAYDPLGRRIWSSVEHEGERRNTTFFWEGDQLVGERNLSSSAKKAETSPDIEYLYSEIGSFEALACCFDDQLWLLECDPRGAPRAVIDAQGELRWQADVGAFGVVREIRGENSVHLRLSQGYADPYTDFYYTRIRYFDPALRIFITSAPIGLLGGNAPYSLAKDPMARFAPLGLATAPLGLSVSPLMPEKTPVTPSARPPFFDLNGVVANGSHFIDHGGISRRATGERVNALPRLGLEIRTF